MVDQHYTLRRKRTYKFKVAREDAEVPGQAMESGIEYPYGREDWQEGVIGPYDGNKYDVAVTDRVVDGIIKILVQPTLIPSPFFKKISGGYNHTVGLTSSGTCLAVGNNSVGQCNVITWSNIKQIVAAASDTIGLRNDGTCRFTGYDRWNMRPFVESWNGITQIAMGREIAAGLYGDGTCVMVWGNPYTEYYPPWTDIVQMSGGYYFIFAFLKNDGTCLAPFGLPFSQRLEVESWTDIVQISATGSHVVGIKSDGTCVIAGDSIGNIFDVLTWTNIVQVAVGNGCVVGVRNDGTCVAAGANLYGEINVDSWSNIIEVACGSYFTIGLKSNGNCEATGHNNYGQCDVEAWNLL